MQLPPTKRGIAPAARDRSNIEMILWASPIVAAVKSLRRTGESAVGYCSDHVELAIQGMRLSAQFHFPVVSL